MDYSNYGLGDKGVQSLSVYVADNPHLHLGTLNLKNNRLTRTSSSSTAMITAIQASTTLTLLDFSENRISAHAAGRWVLW
jgi:hypothetical protein